LAELLELEPLDASCGQLSLDESLLPFELPLPLEVLELADGDDVCANACVTPTPPTRRPVASAIATAPRRTLLVIPDHLLPSSTTSTSSEPEHEQGTGGEPSVRTQRGRAPS
jgi:hypothetical protein